MTPADLASYVARRLLAAVLLLLVLSLGVFLLLYLAPGSPEQVLLGTRGADPATIHAIRTQHHLDDPFFAQYLHWLGGAVQLDFGTSIRSGEAVRTMIVERFAVTLELGLLSFALALAVGLALGIAGAVRSGGALDSGAVGLAVFGVSAPAFVTGIALLYLFAVLVPWFPAFGAGEGFADRLYHLVLPAIALSLTGIALVVKLTRAALIETLQQDYVTFARARGVEGRAVLVRYALRNALVPIVTAAGIVLVAMLTGTVLVEVSFGLPGIGALLVDSATTKDLPVVQALALLFGVVIVLVNLATDVVYSWVDPRIRLGAAVR
ncbi:MAG: ABC transporter permease [Conexibacter sp.]